MEKHPVVSPRHSDACRATAGQDELCPACRDERDWPHTIARLTRERDEARGAIGAARYCLDVDAGPTAIRAALDGMGLDDGIRAEYESDLDRVTRERDEARAEVERLRAGLREVRRMAMLVLRGHRCARCGVWDRPDDPRPELSAECHLRRACEEAEVLLASAETEATDERE